MNSKTESAPSALTFCRIKEGEFQEELHRCIKEILAEGNSHNAEVFSEALWNWQYKNLPTRKSAVYVCLDAGKIAGYYHVSFYDGIIGGEKKKFGMVQDVAVKNYLRGRGIFRQLAEFATKDLMTSGIDLLYTFPNDKSIHTFLKYNGYAQVHVCDSYLLPVKCSEIIKSKIRLAGLENLFGAVADLFFRRNLLLRQDEKITVKKYCDDDVLLLFEDFSSRFPVYRQRSKEYMKWRFTDKPAAGHVVVSLSDGKGIKAAALFKTDKIFNAAALIILDFAF